MLDHSDEAIIIRLKDRGGQCFECKPNYVPPVRFAINYFEAGPRNLVPIPIRVTGFLSIGCVRVCRKIEASIVASMAALIILYRGPERPNWLPSIELGVHTYIWSCNAWIRLTNMGFFRLETQKVYLHLKANYEIINESQIEDTSIAPNM